MTAAAYANPRAGRPPGGGSGRQAVGLAESGRLATDLVFWLTAGLLAAALLFGGASRENALQLMGLELLSLPLIAAALWRLGDQKALRGLGAPLALLGAGFILPLLQLLPIPFEVWRALPGRGELAAGLALAGVSPRFLPLSLTPEATSSTVLALLIPAAVFLGVCACSPAQRRLLAGLVVLVAGLSLILGVLQVAGGPESALRFYPTTNREAAVGLFANRNHQAIFLLVSLPLLATWIREAAGARRDRTLLLAVVALSLFGVVLIGVAITRSRAGLALTVPAVLGCLLLLRKGADGGRMRPVQAGLGLVTIMALTAVALFGLDAVLKRFAPDFSEDYRIEIWPYIAQAAERFSPLGSGLGSFEQVYRSVEPIHLLSDFFVNHAHNDYLELWLEFGWAGLALVALFLVWSLRRAILAWGRSGAGQSGLGPMCGIVVVLLMLHSIVDYPLRTPAIASVLALACAVLARQASEGRAGVIDCGPKD